jgi:hypothetical protein
MKLDNDRELLIEEVIEKFNFEKVHLAMLALDWRWRDASSELMIVPGLVRLKATARHLLRESVKSGLTATGGFTAKYVPKVGTDPEYFELQFILAEADSYDD